MLIAIEQTKATEMTMAKCTQLLDYLAQPICFYASNMIMNASDLSVGRTHSCTFGHFFMGWLPRDDEPIHISGAFHVSTNVIRFVVTLAAEAELGVLFHNCQTGINVCSILADMGHAH
jgi:hypothetical protein